MFYNAVGDVHIASHVRPRDDQLPRRPQHLLADQQLHLPDPVQGGQASFCQTEAGYWGAGAVEAGGSAHD